MQPMENRLLQRCQLLRLCVYGGRKRGRGTRTLCILRIQCRPVTIGTPIVIFAVWLSFDCFFTIGTPLVNCWYSLGRPVTIDTPTVKNSQKTVKTAKMTIVVPIVTCLPRLYQQCTNRQKQSKAVKNSQKTVKRQSKQQKWPLVYQSSHVYRDCTNSVRCTVYQSSKTV